MIRVEIAQTQDQPMSNELLCLEKKVLHKGRDLARNATPETENQLIVKQSRLKTS